MLRCAQHDSTREHILEGEEVMKNICRSLCIVLIAASLVGCSTKQVLATLGIGAVVAGGAAAVYYVKGDLEYDLDNDIDRVYRASIRVMDDRDYPVTESDVGDAKGRIEASMPAGGGEKEHNLTINMERKDEYLTHISIRVGVFGDEALSRAILDDIKSRLR